MISGRGSAFSCVAVMLAPAGRYVMHHNAHFVAVTVEDRLTLMDRSSITMYDTVEELDCALSALYGCVACRCSGLPIARAGSAEAYFRECDCSWDIVTVTGAISESRPVGALVCGLINH